MIRKGYPKADPMHTSAGCSSRNFVAVGLCCDGSAWFQTVVVNHASHHRTVTIVFFGWDFGFGSAWGFVDINSLS